jgi:hypothetical protein
MRAACITCVVAWLGSAVAHAQMEPAPPAEGEPPSGAEQSTGELSAPDPASAPDPSSTETQPAATTSLPETSGEAATATSTETAEPATRRRSGAQVGIAPGTPQTGGLVLSAPIEEEEEKPTDGEWRFDFHGFLRAPMRLGFGKGEDSAPEAGNDGKLHAPPFVPDGVFTDWRYTNNTPGPWVELRFEYGNSRVTGNVMIAAYNITDGGYRNLQSQLGINQAFVTIDWSDLLDDQGGLVWNAGVFQNRYGAAGRYDAGKYETYLFGRTHVAGETLTGFYNLSDELTLTLEHGIGAKIEPPPLVSGLPEPTPQYLPYAGPVQQGTQLVHHAHVMLTWGLVQLGGHYLTTWTDDAFLAGEVDGRITTAGFDAKMIDSRYGDAYLGYSRANSETPLRVGEGLELLHSISGWNLRDNFFGQESTGTGTIDTVLFQYVLSVARLLRYPEPFWGQGPDVVLSAFGMYNHVKSDDPMFIGVTDKFKWGGEATYTPLGFLGISLRYDNVSPDMDDNTQSFSVLSPKLILRSEFVTHEQVVLQYSRYFNGDNVTPAWPNGGRDPDEDVFAISAIMWW